METPLDKNELKTQVQKMVDEMFNAKEETDIRKNTEKALEESASIVVELKNALETKNSEMAQLEEKITQGEAAFEELKSKLEAAEVELAKKSEELSKNTADFEKKCEELAEAVAGVDNMKKDQAASTRMKELEDASVASLDKEVQKAKVREMTDDEFIAYKEELASIRQAVIDELKATAAKNGTKELEKSAASMNMESASVADDIYQKYAELGKAMAERFVETKRGK